MANETPEKLIHGQYFAEKKLRIMIKNSKKMLETEKQ